MTRINLLPPEILERRKAEKRIGWVVLAAIVVAVVLAGVWGFGTVRLSGKKDELAALQQQVQQTTAQANQLAIFEERATELGTRRDTATQALAHRRNWAKLFDELSLVLPADVWLQNLAAGEKDGLQMAGYAVDAPADSPDVGHKTMAKTLVRLADLEQLSDVWLTNSTKATFQEKPAIQFTLTAAVSEPGDETP